MYHNLISIVQCSDSLLSNVLRYFIIGSPKNQGSVQQQKNRVNNKVQNFTALYDFHKDKMK